MSAQAPNRLPPRPARPLVSLADALARSGSRLEDQFWEQRLGDKLEKLLAGKANRTVESALEYLMEANPMTYEVLVEQAENHSESLRFEHNGESFDGLLFSAPILAWTRYTLPNGHLGADQAEALAAHLRKHIVSANAHVAIMPRLVSFDQLPQSFHDTRSWTQGLASSAVSGRPLTLSLPDPEPQDGLLADVLFLIGVVVTPARQALFAWQDHEDGGATPHDDACRNWTESTARTLSPMFTGCQIEYLAPEAYYTSTRAADQRIRPLSLKAAVTWLQTAGHIPGNGLRVAIAACGDQHIEEYRIGFSTRESNEVIYGCIWPALNREEASPELAETGNVNTWDDIAALLRELGIQDIRRLPGIFALEFCEDCGTPYFPNMLGDMCHPELPEEIDPEPMQFH
ncbi:MAG: DUF2863 family protein [Alcaligenaceae bacterium]|nr:DUF2863 family protein [Alcaligenaceae bacterium]